MGAGPTQPQLGQATSGAVISVWQPRQRGYSSGVRWAWTRR